ncbi:hypothetical protein DPMN_162699 [Dreissena polymorpha]|uniref:Uncharacterized protein n=1 Tax=Dreissena polymorpha TaxID=45954 RepID=A0A9D4IU00_DREPO|nr:hypothetical protein DPMN_162699 [Dreissena polymorpha]
MTEKTKSVVGCVNASKRRNEYTVIQFSSSQKLALRLVINTKKKESQGPPETKEIQTNLYDLNSTLNAECFKLFASQVMRSTTVVQVQSLPLTSSATIFHTLSVPRYKTGHQLVISIRKNGHMKFLTEF